MKLAKKLLLNELSTTKTMAHLDLGSGSNPRNPFNLEISLSIDVGDFSHQGFTKVSFGENLPFSDASFASISAYDFLEHIPRTGNGRPTSSFIGYMEEIHRLLEPGGLFLAATPGFPRKSAFSDPTHVNFITSDTHTYFTGPIHAKELGYGFTGEFRKIQSKWILPTHPVFRSEHNSGWLKILKTKLHQVVYVLKCICTLNNPYTHILWVFQKSN